MTSSLVGSEMCIRDRLSTVVGSVVEVSPGFPRMLAPTMGLPDQPSLGTVCLLYTSDAADDM
eukprot:11613405-Prorocentrum_lima.AAC.1